MAPVVMLRSSQRPLLVIVLVVFVLFKVPDATASSITGATIRCQGLWRSRAIVAAPWSDIIGDTHAWFWSLAIRAATSTYAGSELQQLLLILDDRLLRWTSSTTSAPRSRTPPYAENKTFRPLKAILGTWREATAAVLVGIWVTLLTQREHYSRCFLTDCFASLRNLYIACSRFFFFFGRGSDPAVVFVKFVLVHRSLKRPKWRGKSFTSDF